ncbi:fibronectin type III domain-containing protein [Paenibacillus planticolens]|uniref:Fibronectin type-III domain-containing protein n=1 Tax=Paenibacillus planticolens TaxID=2654976 RepID=A0ABX1ZHF5_9BACL|nr:fibronectin type III domain-containing protein [Paenibacillus planticolens]NOU98474.1 hypothetical protein [Paenibacillus planticolens]
MAFDSTKPLKKAGNLPVPQYWNDEIEDWEVVQGSGGSYNTSAPVKLAKEPFSGSANLAKEFASKMSGFVISNDGNADITFTIGGDTYTVKAGEVFEEEFAPFTTVTITSTVAFRAYGKMTVGGIVITPPTPDPDTTAPDNVTNLVSSNITQNSLTLTWTASASSDCVGYDIYRGLTLLGTVTGTVYNVTGLTQATQYTFTVKAKDAANNIASGASVTATTAAQPADTTPPANVTGLTSSNLTSTGVTLSWTASVSSDIKDYNVYNGSTLIATVTGVTYNVTGLTASTSYTFTVKARDTANNEASGTQINVTTAAPADTTAPTNVTNLTTSGLTQTGVTLNWGAATDNVAVTGYDIYNGATFITTVNALTYNVTGLTASTQYTFTVKARDAAGNVSSGTSATVTTLAVALPNPVTGLTVGTITSSSVQLTWTANADHYEVSYSTDGTSYTVANANVKGTSFTITGLNVSTTYTIKVAALDASNNRSTGNPTITAKTASSGIDVTGVNGPSYLSLNSAALDFIRIPSITFNELIIIAKIQNGATGYMFDGRVGGPTAYMTGATVGAQVATTYINGVQDTDKTAHFANIPKGVKNTLRYMFSTAITDDLNIFSDQNGTTGLSVDVYSIKLLNAGTVVAQYDFTNPSYTGGLITDISGTKHATVGGSGGTWKSAATTNPPVVTCSVAEGTYATAKSVTLSTDVAADIYYTTDGTFPNWSSPKYTAPFTITTTSTLRFFAVTSAFEISAVETRYIDIIAQGSHYSTVTGGIQLNSFLADQFVLDIAVPATKTAGGANSGYVYDGRIGNAQSFATTTVALGTSISEMKINGTTVTGASWATSLLTNTRSKVSVTTKFAFADDTNILCKNDGLEALEGKVYSIKAYKNGVLKAHFDFTNQSTGATVTDLTGNGNTCTITGGTWN